MISERINIIKKYDIISFCIASTFLTNCRLLRHYLSPAKLMLAFYCCLSLLSVLYTYSASAKDINNKLLFQLDFDGSATATIAIGKKLPIKCKNLTYATGVRGQAVRFNKNTVLQYVSNQNLNSSQGTVCCWYKPEWNKISKKRWPHKEFWHTIFTNMPETMSQEKVNERLGSGALIFWAMGSHLRGDISNKKDSFIINWSQALKNNEWVHIAFAWDKNKNLSRLFVNGKLESTITRTGSALKKQTQNRYDKEQFFPSFFVGGFNSSQSAEGLIDDFRIYSTPLNAQEILQTMSKGQVVNAILDTVYLPSNQQTSLKFSLVNNSNTNNVKLSNVRLCVKDISNKTIKTETISEIALLPGEKKQKEIMLASLTPGAHQLFLDYDCAATSCKLKKELWVMNTASNHELRSDAKLDKELLEILDFSKTISKHRFTSTGKITFGELKGRRYMEAEPVKNDRFAVRLQLPEPNQLYMFEITYPDDKKRTMDIVAHSSRSSYNEYQCQTGFFCGDEYPNTNNFITQNIIYWAKSTDVALMFMTAREGGPAAVAEVKVYRIKEGLPVTKVKTANAVDGWTRTLGLSYEDPALGHGHNFVFPIGSMPNFERMTNRLISYLKWTGQNMLIYPLVWYHGAIGKNGYKPRPNQPHIKKYMQALLTKFDNCGLKFMAQFHQHNIKFNQEQLTPQSRIDGSLHSSAVSIQSNGKPHTGKAYMASPPAFNIMHPATRKETELYIDDILNEGASHPSFKGIVFYLFKHSVQWFGSAEGGYNDYCIEAFEKDTGIKVAVDRSLPLRGKLYAEWLKKNAMDKWLDWRCRELSKWYKSLANRISARRPDLKLILYCGIPDAYFFTRDTRLGTEHYYRQLAKEAGIDPKYYKSCHNIILSQMIFPADYRHEDGRSSKKHPKTWAAFRDIHFKSGSYDLINKAEFPWVHIHDRYFEDAIGRLKKGETHWSARKARPLSAPWLEETPWRCSALNGSGFYAMEQYLAPFRHSDLLGITKGGFLIGTLGMEDQLATFAKAFRALPAKRFGDVKGNSQTVKVRQLNHLNQQWFYIANTERKANSVTLTFDSPPLSIIELGENKKYKMNGNILTIEMAPYELKAFKTGKCVVTGYEVLKKISLNNRKEL